MGRLPASGSLTAGTLVSLSGYITVVDVSYQNTRFTQEDHYSTVSDSVGGVFYHSVSAGDTLQSLAAAYYGSSAYWYLIADANGLSGTEELIAGASLIACAAMADPARPP